MRAIGTSASAPAETVPTAETEKIANVPPRIFLDCRTAVSTVRVVLKDPSGWSSAWATLPGVTPVWTQTRFAAECVSWEKPLEGCQPDFSIQLFEVTEFYGGGLHFAGERMAEVLRVWRTWAPSLPEQATTSIAVQRLPPLPDLPEPLRGAFVVHVRFAYLGTAEDGERLLAPIRAITPALIDGVRMSPYTDSPLIHLDPPEPIPYYDRTTTLREFTPEVLDALIEFAGPASGNPLLSIESRALGGALDREPAVPNAVPTRGIPYVMFGFGVGGPDQGDLLRGWLERMTQTFAPWAADDRRMVNFLSKEEATTPQGVRLAYGAERYDRLAKLKRRVDPDNMFRVNHNIQPE